MTHNHIRRPMTAVAVSLVAVATMALSACGSAASTTTPSSSASPGAIKSGGSITVLEVGASQGAWPAGLDPGKATNIGSNQDIMDSIYGELFELGPNGATVDDLATGYKFLNGNKTVQITLRQGVTFSDGTPFNAAAVVFNFERDFKAKNDVPSWSVKSFTTPSAYTVDVNLTQPYSPFIDSMQDASVNWIASPTALQKMGETQFGLTPVGAGPFTVVSDTLSSEIVLKSNPHYWQKGHPYLDGITFKSVASDESALEAMQAGQAQAYMFMSTPALAPAFANAGFTTTFQPEQSPYDVQMNTTQAPFNNILAREALYYATDASLLAQKLYGGLIQPTESFMAPGGLFYQPTVAGYRTYDLAKAKAIVKQLGGLSFSLMVPSSGGFTLLSEALQAEWQAAGMKVKLDLEDLPAVLQNYDSNSWQATTSGDGGYDPAVGIGLWDRFYSTSEFSGVHDATVDNLLNEGTEAFGAARAKVYDELAEYLSQKAYAVQLFPKVSWEIAVKGLEGPGLTENLPVTDAPAQVFWEDVGYAN